MIIDIGCDKKKVGCMIFMTTVYNGKTIYFDGYGRKF